MRTGRSLTVCCSVLPGGCLPGPGGAAWSRGGSPWSQGGLPGPQGGSSWSRGGSSWTGGVLLGPGGLPGLEGSLETPPVNRITDTCKNITLATTLLRPVIMVLFSFVSKDKMSLSNHDGITYEWVASISKSVINSRLPSHLVLSCPVYYLQTGILFVKIDQCFTTNILSL